MKKAKYDVGIFGLWYGRNYGSIITYFALKTIVEGMGYSTVMIDNPLNTDPLISDMLPKSHPRCFARKHYAIAPHCRLNEMDRLNEICNAFLLGSDQLWNYGLSKPYKEAYFLDFAASDHAKIAYATSFGKYPYNGPADYMSVIYKYLSRFTGLSVRDDFSRRILKDEMGLDAEQLLDPVFLCPQKAYEGLIKEDRPLEYENYIFAYILDPNPEIGQSLLRVIETSGKQMIIVFDEPSNDDEMFGRLGIHDERLIVLRQAPVNTWLACFQNADFILTDSFHGACFSVIFERQFIVLKNRKRGAGRFDCLLNTLGLQDRMVENPTAIGEKFALLSYSEINYALVENRIRPERERGMKWLGQKLQVINSKAVTTALDKNACVGCGACVAACPKDAIMLKPDEWGYYRSSVDFSKCINCGKCAQICPALHLPNNKNTSRPDCYEFVSSDDEVLRHSSSGGFFTTLAKMILSEGGAVVGAAWKDDFTVEHIIIEREADLGKLQKSKYLQSYMGDTLEWVKKLLDSGRRVLFTGTPCQVTGLRAYLGKDYDNLLAVDIFCSNAPSTLFFKKYIEDVFPEGIKQYEFRYKKPKWSWDCETIRVLNTNYREVIHQGTANDCFQRAFHNHTMCSHHCENCHFQAFPRVGDFSIGDFWGIGKRDPLLETIKGVSIVLCNNKKGAQYMTRIPQSQYSVKKKVPLDWMGGNGFSRNGGKNWTSPNRDAFYKAILKMPFSEAVDYALKPNQERYRSIYANTNNVLRLDCKMTHFHFEPEYWEEHCIEGRTTLIVKENRWRENGHYARLSMAGPLKKGRQYRMSVKFKVRSQASVLNFHVIDSGSKRLQIVQSERIAEKNDGNHWIEFNKIFVPNADYYDEFMVGAAQVTGSGNFLMFAYIDISEV